MFQDEVEDKTKSLEKLRKKLDDQDRLGQRRETMLGVSQSRTGVGIEQ